MNTIQPYLRLAGLEPLIVRPETNFVNVQAFDVGREEDKKKTFNYNLANGNLPLKYFSRKGSTATMNMTFF